MFAAILDHPVLLVLGVAATLPFVQPAYLFLLSGLAQALRFLLGLVFIGRELNDEHTRNVILGYLSRHARSISIGNQHYDVITEPIKSLGGRYRSVVRRFTGHCWRLYLYKAAPIVLRPTRNESVDVASPTTLYHLRWTLNWESLVQDAAREDDEILDNASGRNFYVRTHMGRRDKGQNEVTPAPPDGSMSSGTQTRHGGAIEPVNYSFDDIGRPVPDDPMETVSVTDEMQKVIDEAKFWLDHRQWYRDRGISWQHGFLIHGGPGVGKTSTVRTVGQILDLPVHVFRIATMDDYDFTSAWITTRGSARIVLMEDIDAVFHGRENILGTSFSFDTLLNAIQGVEQEDGLLLFVTTNHLEHIDPALGRPEDDGTSSRPGRVDTIVQMGSMSRDGRLKIARRILREEDLSQRIVTERPEETPAQLTDRAKRRARDVLWGRAA
jgi:hypothetical protein